MKQILSLRFSLRLLLLTTAAIACGVYWLLIPSLKARQFADALNTKDWSRAERLCVSNAAPFPGDRAKNAIFEPRASLTPLTWSDLLGGHRQVSVGIISGDGNGIVTSGLECHATRRGIEVGMAFP